jgi:hypothetical protein
VTAYMPCLKCSAPVVSNQDDGATADRVRGLTATKLSQTCIDGHLKAVALLRRRSVPRHWACVLLLLLMLLLGVPQRGH